MSHPFEPEDPEPGDGDAAARLPDDPGADRPVTVAEHILARSAAHVIEPCARRVAKTFPRLVREAGLLTMGDLYSLGQVALLRAAQAFDEKRSRNFAAFARHIVRYRMLDAIEDLLFEERIKRAASKAEDNYGASFADDGYDVVKHDENEAKRRYRSFASGLFAALFVTTAEEAQQCLDKEEDTVRREYLRAVEILRSALGCFTEPDRQILALVYRDHELLQDAAQRLGIPYGTARARHSRVLKVLHELLVAQGIRRAPRPLVVPDARDLLHRGAPGPQNDTGPAGTE